MNNKKALPPMVIFAILTAITTVAWIGFDIYRAFAKDPAPSVPEEVTRTLDPTLDPATLSNFSLRVHLEEEEIGSTELVNTENSVIQEQVATEEAEVPPVATEEGAIENTEIENTENEGI